MPGSVIVSTARTPIGKLSGALAGFTAMDLGGVAIKAALERGGVGPEQVDYVVMGQVLQAGQGQITARQAALKAGIPMTTPALTINKVCLSGINAIYLADQMIQAGDAEVVVAGGMESMTNAPYLLPKARSGYRMGNGELLDALIQDGLWCAFDAVHMGSGTERYCGIVRRSHPRGPGRARGQEPRAGGRGHQGGPLHRRDRAGGDPPAQGRPGRRRARTRACARAPAPSRSAACGRRSRRTARSRRATRRRSPTARPRSSS